MKVWLIGDSIRMFYENEVREQLGNDYEVFSPKENSRFSLYVLNSVRFWLKEFPVPDIIHFNAGLWDTAILYHGDGCFVGIEDYVRNMKLIFRELKKTGAKLIFATTTPVSDEKATLQGPMPPAHRNEDIICYNNAVLTAFEEEDIAINDLFSAMYPQKEKYLSDDMIHPNTEGVKLLGTFVANSIKKYGKYKNNLSDVLYYKNMNKDEKTLQ
ncbi:MAG: SGNH/GDSL hydrolase family protein [Ruminococcaceae bacterium]|nr:SGNH/GDSL hydrolase family protein [Oscillospiraceae bacterium]